MMPWMMLKHFGSFPPLYIERFKYIIACTLLIVPTILVPTISR